MVAGGTSDKNSGGVSPTPAEGESSDSDGETEPAKSFHRRWSTNREINNSAAIKEGYMLKQTWTFQRWRKRYFKLMGRKLYYSKDPKTVYFGDYKIYCITATNSKIGHSSATVNITEGGVGHAFAIIDFESGRGEELDFNVSIYVNKTALSS